MNDFPTILKELEKCGFKVSTDTRKDVSGSVFFSLKGPNFDGNKYVQEALEKGAIAAVTDSIDLRGDKVYFVPDALRALQQVANTYRKTFNIPVIAIGGSNGKTTSKELIREVLKTKFKVHATTENLNNHIGVPLSILAMKQDVEIGLFEIGANHPGEHSKLLEILEPTIVVVTNNGLDHLEGFGSSEGVRLANKEIYDWARLHNAKAFVNSTLIDLMDDSAGLERILYPEQKLTSTNTISLTLKFEDREYRTNIVGEYNTDNILLAVSVGKYFKIDIHEALNAISQYKPSSKRSELVEINNNKYIIDCYNANPSSMQLSLDSFVSSTQSPRGVILGDMLELGSYAEDEHKKIADFILNKKVDQIIFIGSNFKKVLNDKDGQFQWFENADSAKEWFQKQNFHGFTFLLKGSRGIGIEKIIGM